MDPKGQATKNDREAEEPAVSVAEELQEQVEQSSVQAEESAIKPLDEVLGQAEKAYAAYMEAERQVARIYKENEQQVANAYRRTEQQTNQACEKSISEGKLNGRPGKHIIWLENRLRRPVQRR
jgi:hypothetical protein